MKIPFWEIFVCSCLISITCSENVSEDLNENFEGYDDVLNGGYEIIKFEDHHLTVSKMIKICLPPIFNMNFIGYREFIGMGTYSRVRRLGRTMDAFRYGFC